MRLQLLLFHLKILLGIYLHKDSIDNEIYDEVTIVIKYIRRFELKKNLFIVPLEQIYEKQTSKTQFPNKYFLNSFVPMIQIVFYSVETKKTRAYDLFHTSWKYLIYLRITYIFIGILEYSTCEVSFILKIKIKLKQNLVHNFNDACILYSLFLLLPFICVLNICFVVLST